MEETRKRRDTSFAIIAIVAGLLTGGVLTYAFVRPAQEPPAEPEYEVIEAHRLPYDMIAEQAAGDDVPDEESPAAAASEPSSSGGETTAAERSVIHDAREQMEAEGVTEYVELTEDLFVRLSARMVIFASTLESHPQASDPTAIQGLMADYASGLLARERVDPDEYREYAQAVANDGARVKEMGEKILREAEKHTTRKIDVSAVPGMSPMPVAQPED